MLRILSPQQALLNDNYPERTWEMIYDCGPFEGAWTLDPDGQIQPIEENAGRVQVHLARRTEEELEAGVRALLLRAATTALRPQDVYDYFAIRDTPVGWDHGGIVEVDGEMLVVCDPEFLGVVGRSLYGCGAAIFNPGGVIRVDPTAPAIVRPAINYAALLTKRKRFTDAALRKAKALFFRYLTREQKWELRAHKRVTTVGQDGRTYRIHAWQGGNVHLLEEGEPTTTLCVVPNPAVADIPIHDLMLAQKILLESNVAEFLNTARSWPYMAPLDPLPAPAPPPVLIEPEIEDFPHPMMIIDHEGQVVRAEGRERVVVAV